MSGNGGAARHEVVLVRAVGLALAVGVVLVEVDRRLARARGEQAHRLEGDRVAGAVPDDGVARQRDLGRAVLRVGVVDVVARPVGQHDVGERRVLDVGELARVGALPVELPAAGVAQRVLEGVVPARLVGADPLRGGIHADDLAREEHRVGHRVAGHGDAVLGLEPHDPTHRHGQDDNRRRPRRVRRQSGVCRRARLDGAELLQPVEREPAERDRQPVGREAVEEDRRDRGAAVDADGDEAGDIAASMPPRPPGVGTAEPMIAPAK